MLLGDPPSAPSRWASWCGYLSLPTALLLALFSLACGPGGQPDHCSNGERDEDESDVDCGGSCGRCDIGQTCYDDDACEFQCRGRCVAAFCSNGRQDEAMGETDIDCGGEMCGPCEVGGRCIEGPDCIYGVCTQDDNVCVPESCVDGRTSGNETDVDCGGQSACVESPECDEDCVAECLIASCDICGDSRGCGSGADCLSRVCDPETNTCASATCTDGVQNNDEEAVDCGGMFCMPCHCVNGVLDGNETDVDCGGGDFSAPRCPQCTDGQMCIAEEGRDDCFNSVCNPAPEGYTPAPGEEALVERCVPQTCTDGEQTEAREVNGQMILAESDVDCGGYCQRCGADATCNRDLDCDSTVCDGGICEPPSCTDGVRNGGETGIDCGGPSCAPCTCENGMRDGDEVDVDCGGSCRPCADGMACVEDDDCMSAACDLEICRPTECSNGMFDDMGETDVDCGGDCLPCTTGRMCDGGGDCVSTICTGNACAAPSCSDGVQNGFEAAADCGGGCPDQCGVGSTCRGNADCESGVCSDGMCVERSCSDGLMNGTEEGVDCGGDCAPCFVATCSNGRMDVDETAVDCGGSCLGCAAGAACGENGDCASGFCDGGSCTTPRCNDGYAADNEAGVDCGPVCGNTCGGGEGCLRNSDCASGVCLAGATGADRGVCHRAPEISFFLSRDGEVGRTVTAVNHTTAGDAELLPAEFDWGDGFGPRNSRSFATPGEYEVAMRVRDFEGVEQVRRLWVRVRPFDVRLDPSTTSSTVRVEPGDLGIALDTSFDTATVFSPEDQAIMPGSGAYYFEGRFLVDNGGDWGFGVAVREGDVGLGDAAFIGGDGHSVGVFANGGVFHTGSFQGNTLPMSMDDDDRNVVGMVLDYRTPTLTVYAMRGDSPVQHVPTSITRPIRIVAGGARSHVGPLLQLNTGFDTQNRGFVLDPHARLASLAMPVSIPGLVMGFGGTNASPPNTAPSLVLPETITVAMGETVELTARALDGGRDLSHAVRWENLSETYNDRRVYWGETIRFTPPTIGTHRIQARVVDADGAVTEGTVDVVVTGELERFETVRLVQEMRTGGGIILDSAGRRVRFSEGGKAAIAANQGIMDGFHYFEAQRLGGVTAQGSGLVTPFGNLDPYDQANVPWSCSAQVLGGTWKDFIRRGDWNTGSTRVGWAVDYTGDYPIAYLIVDNAVADRIEMPEIRVPVHPMIYGQPPSFSGWQWQVFFEAEDMMYDPETAIRTYVDGIEELTVDLTEFTPSWGR